MTREEKINFLNELLDYEEKNDIGLLTRVERREFQQWISEALEQKSILDKIRAEIEDLDRFYDNDYFSTNNCPMYKCNEVLLIIDKYRAESEETNG